MEKKKSELPENLLEPPEKEVTVTFNTQQTPSGSKMNDEGYSAIELDSNFDDREVMTPLSSQARHLLESKFQEKVMEYQSKAA